MALVVQKYGGTSVGSVARIQAVATESSEPYSRETAWSLLSPQWVKRQTL